MGNRRFTRLTNQFSKKWQNHKRQLALYFMHYNFCRIDQTLHVTPAMDAGLTDHVWSLEEVLWRWSKNANKFFLRLQKSPGGLFCEGDYANRAARF
jgi:hypothetical protein